MKRSRAHVRLLLGLLPGLALGLACAENRADKNLTNPSTAGDGFLGSASIAVAPGDGVLSGLAPGTGPAAIVDGWSVTYDKFLVSIGDFAAEQLTSPAVHVVDLTTLPDPSYPFAVFDRAETGTFAGVRFTLTIPDGASEDGLPEWSADRDFMIKNGYSVWVRGTLTSATGQSCLPGAPDDCVPATKLAFEWHLDAAVSASLCRTPDSAGFVVEAETTTDVTVPIHGDRWFWAGFTADAERRAQWVADADLDRDGTVVVEELQKIDAADLFGPDYDLTTDAPQPIVTAYDFFVAQMLRSVGFGDDGSCTARLEM